MQGFDPQKPTEKADGKYIANYGKVPAYNDPQTMRALLGQTHDPIKPSTPPPRIRAKRRRRK